MVVAVHFSISVPFLFFLRILFKNSGSSKLHRKDSPTQKVLWDIHYLVFTPFFKGLNSLIIHTCGLLLLGNLYHRSLDKYPNIFKFLKFFYTNYSLSTLKLQ